MNESFENFLKPINKGFIRVLPLFYIYKMVPKCYTMLAWMGNIEESGDIMQIGNDIGKVRTDIESLKIPTAEEDISVTISCGATIFDGQEMDATIKRVDEALYMANNNGRNKRLPPSRCYDCYR